CAGWEEGERNQGENEGCDHEGASHRGEPRTPEGSRFRRAGKGLATAIWTAYPLCFSPQPISGARKRTDPVLWSSRRERIRQMQSSQIPWIVSAISPVHAIRETPTKESHQAQKK
ncbi:unnamed protein product, partial [marine sediment metagenome]